MSKQRTQKRQIRNTRMYPLEYEKSGSVFDHNSVSKYTVFHIQILCTYVHMCVSVDYLPWLAHNGVESILKEQSNLPKTTLSRYTSSI